MDTDFESKYEIHRTAEFIISKSFVRVALQFPDELLKDSTKVVGALRSKIRLLRDSDGEREDDKEVRLFVMADTTYGSCCVDEVGALHVDAECVVHYGHTCLSPTSVLPAFFVFGKAPVHVSKCVKCLLDHASTRSRPIMVLYGLDYAHAIPHIREELLDASRLSEERSRLDFSFATVMSSLINPSQEFRGSKEHPGPSGDCASDDNSGAATKYTLGGLTWDLPQGHKMEDCLLFWIGSDNSAFANVVLTFNGCDIVRYDAAEDSLVTEFSQQRRILKRRYYLVEKAKDANIIGILVGTLGVGIFLLYFRLNSAGYLNMIHQMQELIAAAGKKSYTLAMGRPNPAKLANFPECDVFIYISCAQTALLDSKEFLAPVITPFEAVLAFSRGSQWTGAYVMQFQDLINSSTAEAIKSQTDEPRFSFFHGGYVEDPDIQAETANGEEDTEETKALVQAAEKALELGGKDDKFLAKGTAAKSGPEYFLGRSYRGLEINSENTSPESYIIGRSGKASGYEDEKSQQGSQSHLQR